MDRGWHLLDASVARLAERAGVVAREDAAAVGVRAASFGEPVGVAWPGGWDRGPVVAGEERDDWAVEVRHQAWSVVLVRASGGRAWSSFPTPSLMRPCVST